MYLQSVLVRGNTQPWCRLLFGIIFDSHKPTYCFCYCMFFTSFCPFRLPSKQDSTVNFTVTDTSGITTQYPSGKMCPAIEIAALLLECSSHYAVTVCPVSCELHFLFGRAIILSNSDIFAFTLIYSSIHCVNLCLSAEFLPEITRERTVNDVAVLLWVLFTVSRSHTLSQFQTTYQAHKKQRFQTFAQSGACQSRYLLLSLSSSIEPSLSELVL